MTESPRDRERERRWSTCAADTLRGFRPAPGPGSAQHESLGLGSGSVKGGAQTGNGGYRSTRFFIYVIGGYYITTESSACDRHGPAQFIRGARGATLGQVKPPTATKEDINNSGLEVIQSTSSYCIHPKWCHMRTLLKFSGKCWQCENESAVLASLEMFDKLSLGDPGMLVNELGDSKPICKCQIFMASSGR
ncbi:hypothetical protein EI94DRAFT_1701062 [Lactarius quietus]|nr:hypothetical protein EI94DRAFT_1701062 [Lactarius quietus]